MTNPNDIELLRSFVQDGSDTCFRELVGRYSDMVYSTALRRLSDPGRAQEVSQDVFVCLAQKARLLVNHGNLSAWLYKTTLMKASNVLRGERRRQKREGEFVKESEIEREPNPEAQRGLEHLDEALGALRDKDREAVMLRFFQGYSLREVGGALGLGEEAARKRVRRAVAKLGDFFGRRGLVGAGAATAFAEGVLKSSVHAAPAGFAESASSAALAAGAATGAGSSTAILISKILTMTKLQTTIVCGVLVVLPLIFHQVTIGKLRTEQRELQSELVDLPVVKSDPKVASAAAERRSPLGAGAAKPAEPEDESAAEFLADLLGGVDVVAIEKAQLEVKIGELVEVLGLSDEQVAQLRAQVNARLEKKSAMLKSLSNGGDIGSLGDATSFMEDPLNDLEAILTEEQKLEYAAHREAEDSKQVAQMVDQFVYEELGEIQKLLNLSPEQQDQAVDLLTEYWNDPDDDTAPGGVDAEEMVRFLSPEQIEIWQKAAGDDAEALAGRARFELANAKRLEQFETFLTAEQLEIYRLHLEQKTAELFDREDAE